MKEITFTVEAWWKSIKPILNRRAGLVPIHHGALIERGADGIFLRDKAATAK